MPFMVLMGALACNVIAAAVVMVFMGALACNAVGASAVVVFSKL